MDSIWHNRPELVGFWIDASHSEPPRDTVGTAADTLPRNPCFDVRDIDTDLDEPFGEKVSEITLTEIVLLQAS